ncbi:probable cytochrome P450 6a14 isoform X1 [Neodiprion virginianus]|uniref:probable cytochrome P450 6a14 isoform X1 n=2 Tax=Neodiprion virginianus TaxID=2961670 RepID=UPI001EE6BF2C|nr:probable cytochrome P450 6a14 isoform X1 [Neodiprion virginianus]
MKITKKENAGKMASHSNYFLVEFIGAVFTLIFAAYIYLKYVTYKYWSWRNIDFVKPVVPFGNLWPVLSVRASIGELFRDIYLEFRKSRVVGVYMFHKPALVVNNPDVIRFVLTKQFAHFHDRGIYCNEKVDPLSGHLFSIPGAKWKFLRTKFSPTFTSSKMKQMFFTVQECSEKMVEFVSPLAKNRELIEVKDLVARFSTDVIASVAFGIQCNSIENPNAEFRSYGRKVLRPRPIMNAISVLAPSWLELLRISATDADVEKFFVSAFTETVEYRTVNSVVRKDFLDLIMQLMDKGYVENDDKKSFELSELDSQKITLLEGAAQAFVFWLAGFETSSSTVTNCLYELALHQDIQDKVAEEANRVLGEFGGMSYNGVKEMRYLYKVVSETLRKYPAVPILNRECTAEIDLPETGLHVEKGTAIIIPVHGIHNDPEIYPDPEKFDPERFTEENIAGRHPYAYLPFGEGPRNCIGMRFGLVQTQVALASLLSKYRFTPGPDFKVPMVIDKANFGIMPAGGITLRIEQR